MDPRLHQMMQQYIRQGSFSTTTVNPVNIPFSPGDKVVLLKAGKYEKGVENPEWGWNNTYIAGEVIRIDSDGEVFVSWDNGESGGYYLRDGCKLDLRDKVKVPTKKIKLDSTKLDKWVVEPDTKREIVAVLQQMEHAKKIFEDWGLGENIAYGRGMTMLFHGKPGTGKTFGARCIAEALGMELLVIDAANIQTSEPGGANRNIQNAFSAARDGNKVLLLDECDSLIHDRQGLGMILGSEVNTLLTEIEKFEGVVVLATNRIEKLDPALERRMSLIVEFKDPTKEEREAIWLGLLPKKMPLANDVSIEALAELELTGGLIKNAVLNAARLAVSDEDNRKMLRKARVTMAHFEQAIRRLKQVKIEGKNPYTATIDNFIDKYDTNIQTKVS